MGAKMGKLKDHWDWCQEDCGQRVQAPRLGAVLLGPDQRGRRPVCCTSLVTREGSHTLQEKPEVNSLQHHRACRDHQRQLEYKLIKVDNTETRKIRQMNAEYELFSNIVAGCLFISYIQY